MNRIFGIALLISVVLYYPLRLEILFFYSFLFVVGVLLIKHSLDDFILMLILATIAIFNVNDFESLAAFRYYYWPIVIILLFRFGNIELSINYLNNAFVFFCLCVILEACLVNTIVSARDLPNYPVVDQFEWNTNFAELGTYQRPYSFGGSPTVTSVVLVLLFETLKINGKSDAKKFMLLITSLIACSSGTGFIVLILAQLRLKSTVFLLIILQLIIFIYASTILGDVRERVGIDYIYDIIIYKMHQISEQNFSMLDFLFGFKHGIETPYGGYGGDFSVLGFITYFGVFGFLPYIFIILRNKSKSAKCILFLMLSSLHYGVVFSFIGSMLFAYFYKKTRINISNILQN